MTRSDDVREFDVLVVGGGPGGFPAAIAAARSGARVCLLEKAPYLGGVAVSGLPWLAFTDREGTQIVRGVPHEVVVRLREHGGVSDYLQCRAHAGYVSTEPAIVKPLLLALCGAEGIEIVLHTLSTKAILDGDRVVGVVGHSKDGATEYRATVVIDATGDGDIAASANCDYAKGDSRGTMQPVTMVLRMGGIDFSAFHDYLREYPDEVAVHEGFNATIRASDVIDHDDFCFIGLPGLLESARETDGFAGALDRINFATNVTPGTATINCTRISMVDSTNPADLTRAEIEGRQQALALSGFLTRHVPGFGRAFTIGDGGQIGIRESRHIHGIRTLTQQDAVGCATFEDGVARGAYAIDIHSTHGKGINFTPISKHYEIPYGCLVPTKRTGLLVSGRAISVDPVAFGSSRVMGTCMAVGQAAGTAAGMAVAAGVLPHELDGREVRAELGKRGWW